MRIFLLIFTIQVVQVVAQEHSSQEIPKEYLIITPNCFVSSLQPLVRWRQREGLEVFIKTTQEIKKFYDLNNLSADKLQQYLIQYFASRPNLVYVLLVGNIEFVPAKYTQYGATDLFYSLLDNKDYIPDVYLGRLPISNHLELSNILNKTISYETLWNRHYSILFSMHSETGKFDSKKSFAQKILSTKHGTVAIIAPSQTANYNLSDVFHQGLIEALAPNVFNSTTRLGQVLLRGRIQLVREIAAGNWADKRIRKNLHKYNLLGDPALKIP